LYSNEEEPKDDTIHHHRTLLEEQNDNGKENEEHCTIEQRIRCMTRSFLGSIDLVPV
jgi:hypothetical protein